MHDLLRRYLPFPVFEGDGGGDGGGTGGDGGREGGEGAGSGGDGAWKAPDGIPQEFLGANADETLQKFLGGYKELDNRANGLRDKISKLPAAPKSPDEYSFDPGEKLAPYFGDLGKDEMFGFARQAAHKHGMSPDQFSGFISDVFGPMAEKGLLAEPFSPAKEIAQFEKATGLDKAAVGKAFQQNETFAQGLIQQLDIPAELSDAAKGMFMGLTDTAAGNVILQALSKRLNDSGFGLEGRGGAEGALTEADLDKLTSDPRIDPSNRDHSDPNKRYDPDLRKRYDEGFRRLYP